ncbi:MAG: 3-hydroxyacyl-ACP dehydratase FabZ family protein, partial [Planctomycetota bacterium]
RAAARGIADGWTQWAAEPGGARGHGPGSPNMPAVLMIEGAAQIATFLVKQKSDWARDRMIGLAGLDDVRIRGQIGPGTRVHFVAGNLQLSGRRLARMHAQVFCNGQLTLEAVGMGVML